MKLEEIYRGTEAGDHTGTPARKAGDIINANFKILEEEVFQDRVIKSGSIALSGLTISVLANAYAWRINKKDFLVPPAFSAVLAAASNDYFRYDLLVGNDQGAYEVVQGVENETTATMPATPVGKLLLGVISIKGAETEGATSVNPEELATKVDKVSITPLKSKFILVHKVTDNDNLNIELGDYARGFGPGVGADLEYWLMAIYQNLTGDNNVHNYLNYKRVSGYLPNS